MRYYNRIQPKNCPSIGIFEHPKMLARTVQHFGNMLSRMVQHVGQYVHSTSSQKAKEFPQGVGRFGLAKLTKGSKGHIFLRDTPSKQSSQSQSLSPLGIRQAPLGMPLRG